MDWEAARLGYAADLAGELGLGAGEAAVEAGRRVERMRRRMGWFEDRFAAFLEMQDRVGEAWGRYFEAHPEIDWEDEDAPSVPDPPEQAVADAIYAEIEAAQDGRWPRHLHFSNV